MHGFNTQTTEGDYRIQFQTDSRDEWLLVQQLCRDIMDGKKLSLQAKSKWIITAEFEDCRYAKCNKCKATQVFYYNKPLTNFCPNCGAWTGGESEPGDGSL